MSKATNFAHSHNTLKCVDLWKNCSYNRSSLKVPGNHKNSIIFERYKFETWEVYIHRRYWIFKFSLLKNKTWYEKMHSTTVIHFQAKNRIITCCTLTKTCFISRKRNVCLVVNPKELLWTPLDLCYSRLVTFASFSALPGSFAIGFSEHGATLKGNSQNFSEAKIRKSAFPSLTDVSFQDRDSARTSLAL